jgi:uncharacterized membrane protein YfcA
MEVIDFLIVLVVGLVGGFFNTFMGAGSLLSIPALISLGLPPHVAIATNRLGVLGSDIAGWYEFHVKKMINYRIAIILAVPSLIGAIIGANLIFEFNEANLKQIVGIVTLVILALLMLNPSAGIERTRQRISFFNYAGGICASFIIGIYGGFYGAGAGTFLFYVLIFFFGQTFLDSAGSRGLANFSYSFMASVIFVYKGVINYIWVIPLFVGSFAGSYLSAHYSDRIGNAWLKRLFVAVVIMLVIKLFM